MPKIADKAEVGTIKVGRWEYPAMRHQDGTVTFRSKGSDVDQVASKPGAFVSASGRTAPVAPATPAKATKAAPKATKTATTGTARPKVNWVIGGKCPNGHTLTKDTLYAMPSGRHQCKKCRAGYPSAQAAVML